MLKNSGNSSSAVRSLSTAKQRDRGHLHLEGNNIRRLQK